MDTLAGNGRDEWVLPTLEGLLTPEQFAQLSSERGESYWEAATRSGYTADPLILAALSKRFNMPVADVGPVTDTVRELVPESPIGR